MKTNILLVTVVSFLLLSVCETQAETVAEAKNATQNTTQKPIETTTSGL